MSVAREEDKEDRQKNGCPSRGLGVAAAAIGVGVGAALYYFFNKRAEQPDTEGSTSDWNCQRPQPFYLTYSSDDSYTTISEHDTTDTSVMNDETQLIDDSFEDPTGLEMSVSDSDDIESVDDFLLSNSDSSVDSDSDYDEFDVTTSSLGIPEDDDRSRSPTTSLLNNISLSWVSRVSPRWHRTHLTEEEQMAMIRQEQFRERSWTLEDCSICFDVMLRNQDVTRLPCAHNFHTECILPWLQEKQTCPICRKNAE